MKQASLMSAQSNESTARRPINAALEIGAYEALWSKQGTSFKSVAELFAQNLGARPSDFVSEEIAQDVARRVLAKLREKLASRFDIRLHGEFDYPQRMRDATHPVELLYFQGNWDLTSMPSIAVVGTRKPSPDGIARTRRLVKRLVEDNFSIVSGLADGVDTAAHDATLAHGGNAIAVIGTPLSHNYPKTNSELQSKIAADHLLISQVPVERYEAQHYKWNRLFFPERNKTMSALSKATIIVEAGETSGTLIQAREALKQGRKLFILNSCFERGDLAWPEKFLKEGAIRVKEYDDIRCELVP